MRLLCVGLNHKTAPVALRERLAFDAPAARDALEMLRDRYPQAAFVILSTCNRCELYVIRPLHERPREEDIRAFFGAARGVDRAEYDGALYVHADTEAVRHLFTVAAGLDSLVPGEDQILAQVKAAYAAAQSAQTTAAEMHELFQRTFQVAKEVRTTTAVAVGKVSAASVAADLAGGHLSDAGGKTVLSLGAGKMNALMLRDLRARGIGRILVANRTADRAEEVARACGGQAVPFDQLVGALADADVVVCSTGAAGPVIMASGLAGVMAQRPDRPMVIVDIAVPRDVDPAAGQLPGVTLLNIDDLQAVVEKNLSRRRGELDAGRDIIDRRTDEYFRRLHVREVAPTIEALYRRMRAIADEELAAARPKLTGDRQADERVVRRAFHRALQRMLHKPVTTLRAAAGAEVAREHAAILRKLFDLAPDRRDTDCGQEGNLRPDRRG